MLLRDLGQLAYTPAWKLQEDAHARVVEGGEETVFLVEHPPVITLGRRPGVGKHLLASAQELEKYGVEVVQSDRGGDITFHGPGQIVAYPIVRLAERRLSVGGYVRRLQEIVIDLLADYGIEGQLDPSAVGVWARDSDSLAKICAFGVRVRKGAALHGLALNVTTDLRYFNLIVPCGLTRPVTSLHKLLGDKCPPIEAVKQRLVEAICCGLSATGAGKPA